MGLRARTRLSLRSHLLLLVVGTILPLLVICIFLLQRVIDENRDATERRLLETARAQAALVDFEMADTIHALEALAASSRLDVGDLEGFHGEARAVQRTQGAWYTVLVLALDGQQLVNSRQPWGTPLPTSVDLISLKQVLDTRQPVVGNLTRSPFEDHQFAFPVRVAVVRDGQLRYILSAIITPDRLTELLRRQRAPSDEWARAVVDASGSIVTRTRDPERSIGQRATPQFLQRRAISPEGTYRDRSIEGERVYAAFARAPLSEWTTGVAVPASAVDGPLNRSMATLVGLGALFVVLGGGGAFLISRRIARDITFAAEAADSLALGERPPVHPSSVLEVGRLAMAIDRSSALLEARQRERDEQVARADAARAEAEAADRAKDDFLAMLGHELRNPLAPVLTALQLMTLRGVTEGAREREVIERQTRHLTRLVDDLLDVSRLRRGKVELRRQRFELSAAVAKAVDIATTLMNERGHQLTIDVPASGVVIDGDETRIAQVLANLLTNAAKYADRPGHVTLRARIEGDRVAIECQDDGIGITPELLSHVFDLFAQGERAMDRREGGLGLGLAVARTLTELHGGTIEARSGGRGQGSTFVVQLPLASAAVNGLGPSAPRESERAPVSRPSRRVLVVDDNTDAKDMLADVLREAGMMVETASDGIAALAMIERALPEVCVLDIGLPGMDGFELARRLRALDGGPSLRLIAVSGYGQAADITAAHAAGFDAHLVKPVSVDALLDFICAPAPVRK